MKESIAVLDRKGLFATAFLFLAALSWSGTAAAATCLSTNYWLYTQAEVDALGATGCDVVFGDLTIQYSTDITNLDGLANLTSVGGALWISNNHALTNVDGLANLTSVGGYLNIDDNPALTNLDGLANLTSVGNIQIRLNVALTNVNGLADLSSVEGDLYISANNALTNLDGLANLSSVEGDLYISANKALTNLDGLANLTSVEGDLWISNNDALTSLDGLANLTSVLGYLQIYSNAALTNLDGLANLTSVGGFLYIAGNDALTNVDGLANLSSVEGDLSVGGNAALTNVDGLANLTSVGNIQIRFNAALTNLDGLANLTSVGGDLWIGDNHALTNLDGLANLSSVGGYLNIDYNVALTNLDGLANLTSVGGYLQIYSNAALTNLDGLANLTSVGGNLRIYGGFNSCIGIAPLLGWPSGPPDDTVAGDIDIDNAGRWCTIEQILASVSGPTKPAITSASDTSGGISVEFSSSTTIDALFPITGYEAACTGASANLSEAPATPLVDNTLITRTLTVSDYDPVAVLSDIEVDIDITHSDPADLYITLTTPQGTKLILWDQGVSGGEDIVGTFPTTLIPTDIISTVGRQAMDGDWVLNVEDVDVGPLVREGVLNGWGLRIIEELAANESGSPIEVLDATRGRDYSCTVAPVTALGVLPVSAPYFVTVPPPTTSDSFNSLLQTVQNVRGAGSSQQQATSESSAGAGVAKQEEASVQARAVAVAGKPASIPAVPHYLLLIISSLVGLLGLRRLRA